MLSIGPTRPMKVVLSVSLVLALLVASIAALGGTASASQRKGSAASSSVTVEIIAPLTGAGGAYQPWVNAAVAGVKADNATRGNHVQISYKVCDSGESATSEEACGREAIADHVVGVVNMASVATGLEPFLKSGHIPDFDFLVDPTMYTNPISYSIAPLGAGTDLGVAALAKKSGCKKIGIIRADPGGPSAAAAYLKDFAQDTKRVGIASAGISVTPGTPAYAPYVSRLLSENVDCVYPSGFGSDFIGMVQSIYQANPEMKIYTSPGYVTPQAISSLGSAMNNVAGADFDWTTSTASQAAHPGIKQFVTALNKYAPKPLELSSATTIAWADMRALITGIWKVKGAVTGAGVIKELNTFKNYNPGVSPDVSFNKEDPIPGYSRIFSPYIIEVKWTKAGARYDIGNFLNFFTGKTIG
jgi:ABC-type branched-subunit amino acid transport system substrate-binding protein